MEFLDSTCRVLRAADKSLYNAEIARRAFDAGTVVSIA